MCRGRQFGIGSGFRVVPASSRFFPYPIRLSTRPVGPIDKRRPTLLTLVLAMRFGFVGVLLLTLAGAGSLLAQSTQGAPLPQPVGYVNDFAGVLPPESQARLEDLARRVLAATRGDMVVVTLPDLGGRPVEETSLRLIREWKIGANTQVGDAARNAGVVILVVPKETASDGRGRCRIETGQGAEGFITDAMAGAICRGATERFVARDYPGAIEQIAAEVANRYASSFGVALDAAPPQTSQRPTGDGGGSPIPFWVIVLLFIALPMILSRGRRRSGCVGCIPIPIGGGGFGRGGFGGGGFGGGFGGGGFGGGGFGGGGFGGFGGGGGASGGGGGSSW